TLFAAAVVAACGKPQAAAPAPQVAAATAAPAAAPAPAENAAGQALFGKPRAMCHAAGAAGAPKPGDKADWGPRIAQGKEVLYKHALEGFNGSKGQMPPRRGGRRSDDEGKAA